VWEVSSYNEPLYGNWILNSSPLNLADGYHLLHGVEHSK